MPSTCFISELLPLALRCHFSHVWLEDIRNKLVKNVASQSNSFWPSLISILSQNIRVSSPGDLHGISLITEKPASWACKSEQLFVSSDCDTTGLALPVLSHQHCFLWLCFIHNNQGLGAMTRNEQASKASHKSQTNTVFGGSSRLMAALSSLRLHWDLRQCDIFSGCSVYASRDRGGSTSTGNRMWVCTRCHLHME